MAERRLAPGHGFAFASTSPDSFVPSSRIQNSEPLQKRTRERTREQQCRSVEMNHCSFFPQCPIVLPPTPTSNLRSRELNFCAEAPTIFQARKVARGGQLNTASRERPPLVSAVRQKPELYSPRYSWPVVSDDQRTECCNYCVAINWRHCLRSRATDPLTPTGFVQGMSPGERETKAGA